MKATDGSRTTIWKKFLVGLSALALAIPLAAVPGGIASAEEPGFLSVEKTASVTDVVPGQVFTYTIEVGCTTFGSGCTNAVLTDLVPDGLVVEGTPMLSGAVTGDVTVTGNEVEVVFTNPLADPVDSVGIPSAATVTVTITVRVDPDLPYSASGVPLVNTATADGTNTEPSDDEASVVPTVPLQLGAEATKTIEPDGAPAVPGTALTATLGATSTSNAPVESLTITDPVDPTASPNPFDQLAFTGFDPVTFPQGADQVLVEVWDGTAWVAGTPGAAATLPAGVDAADVRGVRLTFSSSSGELIPPQATASVGLQLVQRDSVADLTDPLTVTNTTESSVGLAGESESSDPASDTYVVTPAALGVTAGKTFSPDQVTAGDPSTATLTGTNTGTPVDSLTITEPSPGAPNLAEQGLTFTGFGTDGSGAGITWPTGARTASVTFVYDDGTTETIPAAGQGTLPQPPPGKTVVGFSVTFSGTIVTGSEATVPFGVLTDPDQVDEEVGHLNEVTATVRDGDVEESATAEDTLTSYVDRLAVDVRKQISPGRVPAVPGEVAVVQLPTQLKPFPDSTTDATHIVVQDPRVVPPSPSPDPWWNAFDAKAVTQTAIPAGATLTIRYWDGTAWVELPGAVGLVGPQIVNIPIPEGLRDQIQGLQFDFEDPDGFPPGTSVQPNFSAELRSPFRDGSPLENLDQTIENCASAAASDGDVSGSAEVASPCPTIDLVAVTPGEGDLIEKEFLETEGGKTVVARSGDQIDARLHWSTGGYSGLDEVRLTDVADSTADVADTVFDAFDLVAVKPITPALDPLMTFDAVTRVELWDGAAWVPAAQDPCAADASACDGTFPGVTLTDAERASTTAVRLVVVESPTRADRIGSDPTAPQVGDGVARSFDNGRAVDLTFEVRDVRRSDGAPALGSTTGTIYNEAGPGDVRNDAQAAGFVDDAQVVADEDSDVVTIIDVPINVGVTKEWSGGPLGVPPAGTPLDAYPSGRVTIVATNTTAAKVDGLTITEPAVPAPPAAAQTAFDAFDVKQIVEVTVPAGATSTTVTLTHEDFSTTTHTVAEALALTSAELADVVRVEVEHAGRIDSAASGRLVLDARLRPTDRTTGAPVTTVDSPVVNTTQGSVSDLGGNITGANPTDDATAQIELVAQDISMTAEKTFSPGTVVEPGTGPVTMTLSGTPGGSARTDQMVLVDDDPRFWNQYGFAGFGSLTLPIPVDRVQVDAFVDATYTAGPSGVVVTGGRWVTGVPTVGSAIALPAGVQAADVQGLRITLTRADGAIWENPAVPTVAIPVQVERRTTMRTGGPVLTDMAGNAPAPGEAAPGVASNSLQGTVQGAVLVDGQPITASDEDDASLLYQHLRNAVTVVKKAGGSVAGGSQPPNVSFPYTLEVTNSGDVPIVDPVITDRLPSDADGAQLVFAESFPGGDGAFSYALSGSAPSPGSGSAMPTDPASVTEQIQGDVEQIRLTFPAGTVLEVGQTYTVTVQLMLRPGLAGGTAVVNTVGVTGERPWDECVGTLDEGTGECQASTTVTVVKSGSLRSNKTVRAVDDELGVFAAEGSTAECVADADGFYDYPCVPRTKPGGEEEWRLHYVNTGNLPMNELIVVDKLPTPGDTGAGNPLPRGSQWRPLLVGTATLANAPAGAQLNRLYTYDPEPCVDSTLCTPESWTLITGTEGPEVFDGATGFMLVVDFPENQRFMPLDVVDIDFRTTTPALSPTEGPDTIAWNSIGGTARTVDEGVEHWIAATEGNKVGVALATGPVSIVKEVTGPGAGYAPDTFDVTLVCRSAVGTRFEEEVPLGDRGRLTLADGVAQTVQDIPWGSECTVEEDDATALPSDFDATTVTVVSADQTLPVVVATNRYDLAGLLLAKTVESAAVNEDGDPVDYGPFTAEVSCTFLGDPVYADGYGPENPMVVTIEEGEQVELAGLPDRVLCTVTETDTGGAVSSSVTVTQVGHDPVTAEGTQNELVLEDGPGTDNAVGLLNRFAVGSIDLTKVVDGAGAEAFGAGPFTVAISCTLDTPGGATTVYDGTVVLGGDQPLSTSVGDLAAGAVCTITEPDDGGATSTVVSPETVTVGTDEPVGVTVTNTFDVGSLLVDKKVTGAGAQAFGAGPFEVSLVCTVDGRDVVVPGGATRALSPTAPASYDVLPVGADCVLTETRTGGATASVVSGGSQDAPAVVEIEAGDPALLTVTNTFDVGEVRVVKRLAGSGAAAHQGDTFTFALTCSRVVDGVVTSVDIPGGATRTASAAGGWVAVFGGIPVGADCQVAETDFGSADHVELVVGGTAVVFPDGPESEPSSPSFSVPIGEDACLPVEVVNVWGTRTGTAVGGTPAGQLAIDAGCAVAPPSTPTPTTALPTTGADVVPLLGLGAVLLAGGTWALTARRRRVR